MDPLEMKNNFKFHNEKGKNDSSGQFTTEFNCRNGQFLTEFQAETEASFEIEFFQPEI